MEQEIIVEVATDPTMFWIAIATGVFAFISALFVVREWLRERRRMPRVLWDVHAWGIVEIEHLKKPGHAVRISNSGTGTAILMSIATFDCTPALNAEPRFKSWHFPAATTADLVLLAKDIRTAWVLLTWREHEDRRDIKQAWFPIMSDTPRGDQWLDSRSRSRRPKWRLWWIRAEQTRAIGPGVHQSRTIRKLRLLQQAVQTEEEMLLRAVTGEAVGLLGPSGGSAPWEYVAQCPDRHEILEEQIRFPRPGDEAGSAYRLR